MSEIKPVVWMFKAAPKAEYHITRVEPFAREYETPESPVIPLIKTSDLDRGALECALVHLKDKLAESDHAIHDTSDLEERQLWKTNSEALRKHIAFLQSLLDVAGE